MKDNWKQIFPYGISLSSTESRPILIFKDKEHKEVLPVWLTQVDAGLAILDSQVNLPPSSPHRLMHRILKQVAVRLEKCFFTDLVGHNQYVELHFESSGSVPAMRVRADEAMSFCLYEKVEFWAKVEFMAKSRLMDQELLLNAQARRKQMDKPSGRIHFMN